MHKIYELKDMLCEELEEYGSKEKLDVGGLDIVDKLAHAIKNIDKIIETYEEEIGGNSSMYPYYSMRGSYENGGGSSNRGSYARGGMRGNSSYARRNSMGRYSRAEDDMDSMVMELRGLMSDLPEEKRREVEKFITKIERME